MNKIQLGFVCASMVFSGCHTTVGPATVETPMGEGYGMMGISRPQLFDSHSAAQEYTNRLLNQIPKESIDSALHELNRLFWHTPSSAYSYSFKPIKESPTHLFISEMSENGVLSRIFLHVTYGISLTEGGKLRADGASKGKIAQVVVIVYDSKFGQRMEWPE